ncbi:FAD:protein FMN transferase [Deinococcus oregonensis]|uniref:FAD:protein FMN transferase n=1 Tax=Deinococcus oregonensis TaxID=1805970 RepID=A0ABV6B060_9DEIO
MSSARAALSRLGVAHLGLSRLWAAPHRLHSVYERMLGTEVELQIVAGTVEQARQAEQAALAELERLTAIFNRFDPSSELRRWLARPHVPTQLSPELVRVLQAADHWRETSGGAFHPGADAMGALWKQAETEGRPPDPAALTELAAQLQTAPWTLQGNWATLHAAYPLGLNALAKGAVVDGAAEAAFGQEGVRRVLVNAGGDLRTLELPGLRQPGLNVEIADPTTARDDAPALARIWVSNGALATSGHAHRGYQVGETWYSHVLDPRNGQPIEAVQGVTVTAPNCLTADALATVLSVLPIAEGLALMDDTTGAAALIVAADGGQHGSSRWGQPAEL